MLTTILISAKIYSKLRFHGFLTLTVGFTFLATTLAMLVLGLITASGIVYQTLLMVVAAMFLTSAILIYDALDAFQKERFSVKS